MKIVIMSILGVVILASSVFASVDIVEHFDEGNVISVGDTIYYKSWTAAPKIVMGRVVDGSYYIAEYVYEGIENNNLRINFIQKKDLVTKEGQERVLQLPINDKKQALLSVKPFFSADKTNPEILVSIADEFNRIKIEKYKK